MRRPSHERPEVPFKRLCAIATELRADDDIEWKHRVKDRVWELGFRLPHSNLVYRAIDAIKFTRSGNRIVQRPLPPPRSSPAVTEPVRPWTRQAQESEGFVPVSSLSPRPPENACGCSKPVTGRPPLTCTRPAGHDGDHGLHSHGLLLVRWSR
jgi:hypothetical protein